VPALETRARVEIGEGISLLTIFVPAASMSSKLKVPALEAVIEVRGIKVFTLIDGEKYRHKLDAEHI
jgi:hypothetical protein